MFIMKIKGAMTILNKRCDFFGWTFDQLITKLDEGFDDNNSVVVAYEVYKMDQGFVWNNGWVKDEPRDNNGKLVQPDGSHVFPDII